jgi:hypothetical protein
MHFFPLKILVAPASAVIVDEKSGSVKSEVRFWHEAEVQQLTGSSPLTGAKPTLGAECRVTGAFQTFRWHAAKVGS